MSRPKFWTDEKLKEVVEIAGDHTTLQSAVKKLRHWFSMPTLTRAAIDSALKDHGLKGLAKHLSTPLIAGNQKDGAWWNEKRLETVLKCAKLCSTREEAARAISEALGKKVTATSIDLALYRANKPTLAKSLSTPLYAPNEKAEPPTPKHLVTEKTLRERADRAEAQVQELVEELRDAERRQEFLDAISDKSPPKVLPREKKSGMREMTAVVLASDWHVEETVEAESVDHLNEYNLEIAEKRVNRFFESIIWNFEHHRASGKLAIRDLVLWLGGDLMTGYIHEELEENNGLSPTQTVLWLQRRLIDGIHSLRKHLDLASLIIPCSYGNHGRTGKKSRISTGYKNSYEWMMYHQIADAFRGEKGIKFEITNGAHQFVQTYDRLLHFHHGDSLKYNGGIGGLSVPLLRRIPAWNSMRPADVHNIGHFHQLHFLSHAVVNSSLIGHNAYAVSIGAAYEPPQQASYFMDSRRGKCLETPLWVDGK